MRRSTTRIYQGASYTWQGWEELTQWADDKALAHDAGDAAQHRSRHSACASARTTNPDGAGHNWVKARYQASDFYALGDYVIGPRIDDGEGPPRRMIYSKLNENQLLLTVQPDYLSNIKAAAIDEGKYEAWTKGSWEILSGDLFGDLWPAAKPYATLPSFPAEVIPPTWRIDRVPGLGRQRAVLGAVVRRKRRLADHLERPQVLVRPRRHRAVHGMVRPRPTAQHRLALEHAAAPRRHHRARD